MYYCDLSFIVFTLSALPLYTQVRTSQIHVCTNTPLLCRKKNFSFLIKSTSRLECEIKNLIVTDFWSLLLRHIFPIPILNGQLLNPPFGQQLLRVQIHHTISQSLRKELPYPARNHIPVQNNRDNHNTGKCQAIKGYNRLSEPPVIRCYQPLLFLFISQFLLSYH